MERRRRMEILEWEIVNYKNGKEEGEWKGYHENGNLEEIGNYKNGKARRRMESLS